MDFEARLHVVVTTIQPPTASMVELHRRLKEVAGRLVVAGDRKGPATFDLPECDFLSLAAQSASGFRLAETLPVGHYARKNIGYLHAIRSGAACIYETDDDNAPLASWCARSEKVQNVRRISSRGSRWVNVYKYFTPELIWPRGLPLEEIHARLPEAGVLNEGNGDVLLSPIQQGLVNGSPDVDAVWRLTMDRPFEFENQSSIYLEPGNWCPFNTQSTWWWPVAFPLLYVPSHCSFRMCDIWKSFVAQRCLWAMGKGVVFHAPEVVQDRNTHDLSKDFEAEVPGYLFNARIATILNRQPLSAEPGAAGDNLKVCYAALVEEGIVPAAELGLIDAWLGDLGDIRTSI
jgi:hypothetical protein